MKLTTKELQKVLDSLLGYEVRFCEEYIVDFNALKAVKRAGIHGANKPTVTTPLIAKMMSKENINRYIAHLQADRAIRTNTTPDRVLEELGKIAFQDVRQFLKIEDGQIVFRDLDDMPNTQAIKDIEVADMSGGIGKIHKVRAYDKLKALELLAKHHAMFTENINITGQVDSATPGPTVINQIIINHRAPGESLE